MNSVAALSLDEKRLLVARLLWEKTRGGGSFPLSFAQQRLWMLDQLTPGNAAYNIPAVIHLSGHLIVAALEQSLGEVVRRHEILRTTFAADEERATQVIRPSEALVLPVIDLRGMTTERAALVRALAKEACRRPFDLQRGPVMRAHLLRVADQEHVLLLTVHHIVADGWSLGVLVRETAALYDAFPAGRPSPLIEPVLQYANHAILEQQSPDREQWDRHLEYWKKQLAGAPSKLDLPADRPRPAVQSFRGAVHAFALPAALTKAVMALSCQEGATLFMTLLAAWSVLLYRYTAQEDIVVGAPVANRGGVETERLIGFFVNMLALRIGLAGNPTVRELMARVRNACVGAYAHQEFPFEQLVKALQPERDLSRTPLFNVVFILQNAPMPALTMRELTLSLIHEDTDTAKFDLTLSVVEGGEQLHGALEYSTDLFDAATMVRLAGHFERVLEAMAGDCGQRIDALSVLTDAERTQVGEVWNATAAPYPADVCLHQLVEAQAVRTPDAVAVVRGDEQVSYRQLNRRANQLAHHLRRHGVGPEVAVGICLDRSPALLVALLGVLKAGGAYVPLDPAYPRERLALMLAETRAPVVLTRQDLAAAVPPSGAHILALDTRERQIAVMPADAPAPRSVSENLAYILYTSGSTGRPKGIGIAHRNTIGLLSWARENYTSGEIARVLASTSINFDLSAFELWLPLTSGGRAVLVENAVDVDAIVSAEVSLINTVPSAMTELVRSDAIPASVRVINLAGEPLPPRLAAQLSRRCSAARVVNLYGPTETTTYSTSAVVERDDERVRVPIGRPISNTQAYVCDRDLRLMPLQLPGQLYLGGAGLARGYVNRPDLTAERFVPNPFDKETGSRLYQTGDRVRWTIDGTLDFLGRVDGQVKVRGFRVELGEIEAVLARHPTVRDVVVAMHGEDAGEQRLVAYLVCHDPLTTVAAEWREFLQEWLPAYMVPTAFVVLDRLPLTANAKVDRSRLPVPESSRPLHEQADAAPPSALHETIARVWEKVLRVDRVGIFENFFDAGGHSLSMVQVRHELRRAINADIPLVDLFRWPTIDSLARHLRPHSDQPHGTEPVESLRDRASKARAERSRRRRLFMEQRAAQ